MNFKCKKCNQIKHKDEFKNCNACKHGVRYTCKNCGLKYDKEYRIKNQQQYKDYHIEYRIKNRDKLLEYFKENNKRDIVKKQKSEWYEKNKHHLEKGEKRRLYRYEYNKKSITLKWRSLLHSSLKRIGKSKEGRTIDLLGYSALELKGYIESLFTEGMSWDNHGDWHIDHIKPLYSFDSDTPISEINALSNLQPLWATTREINGVIYEGNLNKGITFN